MYLLRWKCALCVIFLWRLIFRALLMNASECSSVHVLLLIYLKNRHDWSSFFSSRRWIHTKSAFFTEAQWSVGCPFQPKEAKIIIKKKRYKGQWWLRLYRVTLCMYNIRETTEKTATKHALRMFCCIAMHVCYLIYVDAVVVIQVILHYMHECLLSRSCVYMDVCLEKVHPDR